MAISLVGRKLGMSRYFDEAGNTVGVTVIEVLPNYITQVKTPEKEGFHAIQVTTGSKKASKVNKPSAGHYAKANIAPGRGLWEFPVSAAEAESMEVGKAITAEHFQVGQKVDVIGTSIGKGFAGCIKRHNFRTQDASHGNSVSHRAPGSIGQNQTPGRVFKGKKMAGHMGAKRCTMQNIEVMRIDTERNLILVRGAVAGSAGGDVIIQPTAKIAKEQHAQA